MRDSKGEIAKLLFQTKGVVNFNSKNYIEVQPGIMSPMIINIKSTLANVEVRKRIAEELAARVSPDAICICGIESGGSYYASVVADLLNKPLVLFRKESKKYGVGDRFVGTIPDVKDGLVAMVDDVLAGGMISTANNKALTEKGYRSELNVVYSYLPKMSGPMAKVKVSALTNIDSLCEVGLESGIFTEEDVRIIKKECVWTNSE